MLEVFKPSPLNGGNLFDYSFQAVSIAALGLFPDIVFEFSDAFICREFHPLLELIAQKFKNISLGV